MDDYSTLLSALQNQAKLNNSWSAEQAQKQMEFQERMSNTAHLREIADLKSAGLNPILSAKLGGASTPSGASATADTSIVSAMSGLLEKVLDVADNSAKAVSSVAKASNGNVMISPETYEPSGKSLLENIRDGLAVGSEGISGKELPKGLNKIVNTDALAAFVDGVLHWQNPNKNTDKSYTAGKTIGEAMYADQQSKMQAASTIVSGLKSGAKSLYNTVNNLASKVSGIIKKSPSAHSKSSYKGSAR